MSRSQLQVIPNCSSRKSPCDNLGVKLKALKRLGRISVLGGSPGLVVMGGDSCSKGREFESLHQILDGHFSHLFVVKLVMCV